jgi:hypothetical protein
MIGARMWLLIPISRISSIPFCCSSLLTYIAAMRRKDVAAVKESTSSSSSDDAPSFQHKVEDHMIDHGKTSTHGPADRYTEMVEPLLRPSHTIPADKEPAYTT